MTASIPLRGSNAWTFPPDTPLDEVAGLLERNAIKRVPIVKDKKVVGIVSRANLLQALAALRRDIPAEARVEDAALRDRVLSEIKTNLDVAASQVNVIVRNGVVELWGQVDSGSEKDALRVAAESTPGVRSVEDHIAVSKLFYGV